MDTKALKQKILDLAIRGKLVPQDPNDEPASALLERIRAEKQQMVKDGKLKAKDLKNDTVIFVGDDNLHYEKFSNGAVKCIEDEIPYTEPLGWCWCRIGSLFQTITGNTPSTNDSLSYGSDYPFYKPADLDSGFNVSHSSDTVSHKGYSEGRQVPRLSVLVTCIGSIGKTGLIRNEGICNQQINAILPSNYCVPEYTFFAMCSDYEQEQMILKSSATTLSILNKSKFDNLLFILPPIAEQKKIANKVQSVFSLIEIIENKKLSLKELIDHTKSKILDLAIRGKLVPQDSNDEPASVLLDCIRKEKEELIGAGKIKRDKRESVIFRGEDNSYYEKFSDGTAKCIEDKIPYALPCGWCWVRLGTICSNIQYGLSNSAQNTGNHRLLRITDIQNGMVEWDKVPFTDVNEPEPYLLKQGDIVFARTGATVGKSFLINELPYESVFASYLIRIRLIGNLSQEYIYNFFNSKCYWEQITDKSVGVGQPNCNGTSLKELFVPLPPLQEQKRIIDSIRAMMEKLNCVENNLT